MSCKISATVKSVGQKLTLGVQAKVIGVAPDLSEYVKFTDYATRNKAGVVSYYEGAYGGIDVRDGKLCLVGTAYSGSLSDAFFENPQYYGVALLSRDLYRWIKVGLVQNTETWTDDEKASACETIGAVKKDASVSTNQSPLAYTNDTARNHYLATTYRAYAVYNIPMIYGGSAGKDAVNGHLLTAVPVNDYHTANKKYVDDGFVPKTTTSGNRVYASQSQADGSLVQTTVGYASSEQARTLALRESGGALAVGTPTSDAHAVNKKYAEDNFVKQIQYDSSINVNNFSGNDGSYYGFAYAKRYTNEEFYFPIAAQVKNYSMPIRDYFGNFYVGTPQFSVHCANKDYVDGLAYITTKLSFGSNGTPEGCAYFTVQKSVFDNVEAYEYFISKDITQIQNAIPCSTSSGLQCCYYDAALDVLIVGNPGSQNQYEILSWTIL